VAEGYKDWTSGDVLTAADLEDYTVKQSVMRFASAAARNSALASVLDEGMMAWLDDVNCMTVYSGSAWSTIGPVHGALTSWAPTVTQSGSVTVTVNYATYQRIGRMIIGEFKVTVTGSGSASNAVTIGGIPVTASVSDQLVGSCRLFDTSASQTYMGHLVLTSTTQMSLGSSGAGDARLGLVGFTAGLASNDVIYGEFQYEAAADA
jgi:hypothetical protein